MACFLRLICTCLLVSAYALPAPCSKQPRSVSSRSAVLTRSTTAVMRSGTGADSKIRMEETIEVSADTEARASAIVDNFYKGWRDGCPDDFWQEVLGELVDQEVAAKAKDIAAKESASGATTPVPSASTALMKWLTVSGGSLVLAMSAIVMALGSL